MESPDPSTSPLILCVDDELSILKALQRLLVPRQFRVAVASDTAMALELMQQQRVNLVICDMRMPQMSGAEFLAKACQIQPDCYRILMTGYADLASTVQAINIGKIHRYIQKPWQNDELLAVIEEGLEYFRLTRANKQLTLTVARQLQELKGLNQQLEQQVSQRTSQLRTTLTRLEAVLKEHQHEHAALMEVLYNLISSSPYLKGELALNISHTAASLARQLGLEAPLRHAVRQAGLFCELGKLALPVPLLSQPYYQLSMQDRQLYLQHPLYAQEILAPATHLHDVSDMLVAQYEKFGGAADQPRQGTDIPIGARILAVARDYWLYQGTHLSAQAMDVKTALEMIVRHQGTWYDPEVVMALSTLAAGLSLQKTERADGLLLVQLKAGMKLQHNLFNRRKVMLLPKGHVLTAQSIASLQHYQTRHQEELRVPVEHSNDLHLEEEE